MASGASVASTEEAIVDLMRIACLSLLEQRSSSSPQPPNTQLLRSFDDSVV